MGLIISPSQNPMSPQGWLPFGQGMPDYASLLGSFGGNAAGPDTAAAATPANLAITGQLAVPGSVAPPARTPGIGAPATPVAGAAGAGTGWFNKIGGLDGMSTIAGIGGDLGQLWTALQGVKLAREQMNLNKETSATNLANQTQSYNTTLEDRTRQRYAFEGKSASQADTYLKAHSL